MKLLVLNCGSSSIKHRLYDMPAETELAAGVVEGIGSPAAEAKLRGEGLNEQRHEGPIEDHAAGVAIACDQLNASGILDTAGPAVVAHRVVHGGESFSSAAAVDDPVLAEIERLAPMAPLHNPMNALGIRLLRERFPAATHVAAFDTAFHRTIPDYAACYAIPSDLANKHGIRRYGFHGASHRWASQRAAEMTGKSLEELRTVVLHLGAGASATAVLGGRSIDTSMGFTPLEGLVMATRCGDIDPGVLLYLQREVGLSIEDLDRVLNRQSGLAGLAGNGDLREVLRLADEGEGNARLALEAYVYRVVKQVGAFAAALGGLDALVFTAGVGERSPVIRARVVEGLAAFGIALDSQANATATGEEAAIHSDESRVDVLVVPANEELQIAREAVEALGVSS